MNKNKKIVTAVVSLALAGTMVGSIAGCTPDEPSGVTSWLATKQSAWNNLQTWYDGYTASSTTATAVAVPSSKQTIPVSIGYDSKKTGITYNSDNAKDGANHTYGGVAPTENTLKGAWKALGDKLNITFDDKYNGDKNGVNITNIRNNASLGMSKVAIMTASITAANNEQANNKSLLDINTVLDKLPNYKAFLESNVVAWASLINDANTGAMYMLPYFDGNDDIEKYTIIRKDIVESLLNDDGIATSGTTTYAAQGNKKKEDVTVTGKDKDGNPTSTTYHGYSGIDTTKASVESFIGKVAADKYTIAVTNPAALDNTAAKLVGNDAVALKSDLTGIAATVNVTVDYGKVITALKDSNSELYKAVAAALPSDTTVQSESGNIIDIQNQMINATSGAVTGGQLVKVLRAYIDVAYTDASGNQFYTATNGLTRSSVFNSACAAWDVDLYVALGRCFVTSGAELGDGKVKNTDNLLSYLLAGRAATSQRMSDMYSLAGELYGVRGLESRYNFDYIDKDGKLQDARADEASWNAVAKLSALAKEGLLYNGENVETNNVSTHQTGKQSIQSLSIHDYVQTQTNYGFQKAAAGEGYNFAPILTAVSKWNDGTGEKVMRFTESWRGVKDGGLVVSNDWYKNATADQQNAVLKFIDYCYSDEGQILTTYGTESTTGNSDDESVVNGMWYGTKLGTIGANGAITWVGDRIGTKDSDVIGTHDGGFTYYVKPEYKAQAFVFNGTVYSGTYYNGKQIPTMTDANLGTFASVGKNNFTNYARQMLGTTIQFNKDQGFEYQCTSDCGKVGAAIVNIALNNGTMKHPFQTLNGTDSKGTNLGTKWYTLATTSLPFTRLQNSATATTYQFVAGGGIDKNFKDYGFNISGSSDLNLYDYLAFYGYGATPVLHSEAYSGAFATMPSNATDIVKILNDTYHLA